MFLVLAATSYLVALSYTLLFVPFVVFFLFLLWGTVHVKSNFFIKGIHKLQTDLPLISLTFDDGPDLEFTPKVLEILKEYGYKATFFCIGKKIEEHPDLIRLIHESGHEVGNHSYSHSSTIDWKSTAGWKQELHACNKLITTYTGNPTPSFRPPYGITTPHLALALPTWQNLIGWNCRAFDTQEGSSKKIVAKLKRQIDAGSIVLLHDTHPRIIPILEQLLPYLKSKGLQSVSVKTLLAHD